MLIIKAESIGGATDLIDVATEVINFARRVGAAVEFDFNGKELLAQPWHKPEDVVGQYYAACGRPTTGKEGWVVWEEPRDGMDGAGRAVTTSVKVRCTVGEAAQMQRRAIYDTIDCAFPAWSRAESELVAAFMESAGAWYEVDG